MENVYQTPSADLTLPEDRPAYSTEQSPFFVTSTGKLVLLYLVTMGIYSIYWFYKHWTTQKRVHNANIIPAARSILNLFFTHSLFSRIEDGYQAETGKPWNYAGMAWLYVISSFISHAVSKLSANTEAIGAMDIMVFAFLPLMLLPLYVAQKHANIAARDPRGTCNENLSLFNWLFIVPCGLFWILSMLGFAISLGLLPDSALQGLGQLYSMLPGDN